MAGQATLDMLQVRNAASGIVQLTYGDDSLDPVSMEGKDGSPIDFVRTLSQIKAATPHDDAPGLCYLHVTCVSLIVTVPSKYFLLDREHGQILQSSVPDQDSHCT